MSSSRPGSPAKNQRRGRQPEGCVLVLGEDANDTRAIRILIEGWCPEYVGRVRSLRQPPVLIRDAKPADLSDRADRIRAAVNAVATDRPVSHVVAHEDCDNVEPAHCELIAKIETTLRRLGVPVIPAAPAWELETWLFLWPDAAPLYRQSWRAPADYVGRDLGQIEQAKEVYRRAVRPRDPDVRTREYRESDAPEIMTVVVDRDLLSSPRGRSASFDAFRDKVTTALREG